MRRAPLVLALFAELLWTPGCAASRDRGEAPSTKCPPCRPVQFGVGVQTGLSIPGQQDLKFKRYDASSSLTDFQFSNDVDSSTGPFENLYVVAWLCDGPLRNFGLQVEAAHWQTTAQADTFVNRMSATDPGRLPPFDSVSEDRVAILLSLLHRFPMCGSGSDCQGPYCYVGLGAGRVHTAVTHGHTAWAIGGDVLGGMSFPLTDDLRLRVEGRFWLTHDADSKPSTDWRVDTSGTPNFPVWPHLDTSPGWPHTDTRFYDILLGLEFDF